MDGGMDGRVRHAYPVPAPPGVFLPVLYSVLYCSVPVNVPVARAGGVHVGFISDRNFSRRTA